MGVVQRIRTSYAIHTNAPGSQAQRHKIGIDKFASAVYGGRIGRAERIARRYGLDDQETLKLATEAFEHWKVLEDDRINREIRDYTVRPPFLLPDHHHQPAVYVSRILGNFVRKLEKRVENSQAMERDARKSWLRGVITEIDIERLRRE